MSHADTMGRPLLTDHCIWIVYIQEYPVILVNTIRTAQMKLDVEPSEGAKHSGR